MKKKEQLDPNVDNTQDQQGDESLKAEISAPNNETETSEGQPLEEAAEPEAEIPAAVAEETKPQPEIAEEPVNNEAENSEPEVEKVPEEEPAVETEAELPIEPAPEQVIEDEPEVAEEPFNEPQIDPAPETSSEAIEVTEEPALEETPEADEEHAPEETPETFEGPSLEETPEAVEEPVTDAKPENDTKGAIEKEDPKDDEDEEDEEEVEEEAEEEEGDSEVEDLNVRYGNMSREELVLVLEALVKNEDINYIRKHIGYIKAAFRKLMKDESLDHYEKHITSEGQVAEATEVHEAPVDPLNQRFEEAMNIYRDKKFVFDQVLERQKQENLDAKERILEDLRSLIESEEELKKTYDQFRDLQEKWRDIGAVPQNAKNTLWNNYHFLVEKFFDKIKINKELKDLDLKKNLEQKAELCEKAEELLLEPSIVKSFQRLQKLHEAWKETGPVPNDKKDEIWERFRAATEKLNKRRQEYYDGLRDEQQNNLTAKLVLCEKAEQLAAGTPETPRQWQDHTNQINELFKMWKSVGFAPKKVNNEVWNRFRSALDGFFRNKKDFFQKFKENQTENYNQKLNLCLQAEALKESTDWRRTTDELIALQHEWKKIGTVPNKFSDKIWKRFRAACDEFFKKKAAYFSNIGEMQEENLQKKKDIIEQIRNHAYSVDNAENLKIINEYQRQWMDIGHVPIKQKDKIQGEYRKVIDEQFEKLGISKKAKSTLSFRSKIENIKNTPNADHIIYKERNFLLTKISALQSDIKVWENNIGFFASSKKADILKNEFEEKIETAKQEITIMEEKLKILRES
jgi:hypothetical protein